MRLDKGYCALVDRTKNAGLLWEVLTTQLEIWKENQSHEGISALIAGLESRGGNVKNQRLAEMKRHARAAIPLLTMYVEKLTMLRPYVVSLPADAGHFIVYSFLLGLQDRFVLKIIGGRQEHYTRRKWGAVAQLAAMLECGTPGDYPYSLAAGVAIDELIQKASAEKDALEAPPEITTIRETREKALDKNT